MSETGPPHDPLFSARAQAIGRRRTAPRAESNSDVRRFSGVWGASVAAALAVLIAAVLTVDPKRARSPGPLSRPHVAAALDCYSCHGDDASYAPQVAARSCVGCHGAHPSVRAGHRRLAEAGALGCIDCHAVHDDLGGVAFTPAGEAWRFGPGADEAIEALAGRIEVASEVRVPLVAVRHCARCHNPNRVDDPIARCVLADQSNLGDARPTVCFDEHRAFEGGAFARGAAMYERTRMWSAAREAAAAAPVVPTPAAPEHPAWWWLVFAVVAGLLAFVGIRVGHGLVARWRRRKERLSAPVSVRPPEIRRLPQIDTTTCIGCHACVDACPYDVLEVRSFVAKVVRPDDCCGLTLCEQRCPNGSLVITDGEPIEDRPRVDEALESTDTPGLYVAGDLTGLPLIRNAINQGATATRAAVQSLAAEGTHRDPSVLDLVIVGSGPAGLSASLAAAEAGLRYVTLEQGSVAESIQSFPRGKLVFDQPLGLPLEGDLWLRESTKEELLGQWRRIIRARRLAVEEHTRVTAVRRLQDSTAAIGFEVSATQAEGAPARWLTRRVILALGRRGTPRKLPVEIPEAARSRVHYSLADARSFAGQRVLVVGLGDVAMEAAIGLARQPDTTVTVSYRGDDFRRGKGRNIEQIKRLAASGRLALRLGTEVATIEANTAILRGAGGEHTVEWDTMFVMIGSLAPWPFLEAAGVHRARVHDAVEAAAPQDPTS